MDILKIKKEYRWLVLIFIIALLVRIIFVFSMPIKLWDETIYLNLGADLSKNFLSYSFSNGWSDFIPSGGDDFYGYPKAGFRAPLLPYLISIFYFFNLEFLVNFLLPLVGALSVIAVFKLGKELFNEKVALTSSLFFAFVPIHVFYSARVLTDVLFTFFVILTFISFWKGFEKENKKHKVLFGFFLALTLLSRYTALWIIPMFIAYFLIRDKSLKIVKDKYLWFSILTFFATLIPWLIYGFLEYHNPFGAFIHGFKASAYWGGIQPWNFFFYEWWQMFSIIGVFFVIAFIYIVYKKEILKKEIYLLFIWFFFFLAMVIYMPHKEDRFILAVLPVLVLISGYFLNKIRRFKVQICIIILIILIFSLFSFFGNTYKTYHNINTDCFEQIGQKIKTIQGDFLIVSENPPLFRYYAQKENVYYPDNLKTETIKELVNSTNKKIYFVFTKFNSGFETEKWENLNMIMKQNYNLVFECLEDRKVNWIYSN